MDKIVAMVSEKAGISEEQAGTAVATVLNFLKEKLPPGIGQHLDTFIAGEEDGSGDGNSGGLGGIKDKLGGMFGG